jgi:hypothetical protein
MSALATRRSATHTTMAMVEKGGLTEEPDGHDDQGCRD